MEEELRLIDQGVEMKSIVKKLQTVRCAYDTSTLFLRDACFSVCNCLHGASFDVCLFSVWNEIDVEKVHSV